MLDHHSEGFLLKLKLFWHLLVVLLFVTINWSNWVIPCLSSQKLDTIYKAGNLLQWTLVDLRIPSQNPAPSNCPLKRILLSIIPLKILWSYKNCKISHNKVKTYIIAHCLMLILIFIFQQKGRNSYFTHQEAKLIEGHFKVLRSSLMSP